MIRKEVTFDAVSSITPDFAAKLANCASSYNATVYLERDNTMLCVDSLIGILALALRRGSQITIAADGNDAQQAVLGVAKLLCTRMD